MGASEPVIYIKVNGVLPDLKKMGWRWFIAVGAPLAFTTELRGWMQVVGGICLGIVLLLTALGLLRWLVLDPLRETLSEAHPDDLEVPVVPPLL